MATSGRCGRWEEMEKPNTDRKQSNASKQVQASIHDDINYLLRDS